jgi:hypothetical protein
MAPPVVVVSIAKGRPSKEKSKGAALEEKQKIEMGDLKKERAETETKKMTNNDEHDDRDDHVTTKNK